MKKVLTGLMLAALVSGTAEAGIIKGTVEIAGADKALSGARVKVLGTAVVVQTNSEGVFALDLPDGAYRLEIAAPGYMTTTVDVKLSGKIERKVALTPAEGLSDTIIVTANRANARDTPVAFSNVTGEEIELKYTTQDVPELLKSVPGVFTQSSGLGEAAMTVRGFDSEHVQIMINNVPVNDPESQVVYWSNWTGLSGNAADIQVQRGVGSSLLGSGAFGGSVNIETDNFDADPAATFTATYGLVRPEVDNPGANYILAGSYGTGDIGKAERLNFYVRYERKAGESYIEGTNYYGHSYYTGLRFTPNAHHQFTFNFHGAPQLHNQAANVQDPNLILSQSEGGFGRTWNRRNHPYQENYYFKPVLEAHHDWSINTHSTLNTTLFATSGSGGGRYLRNDFLDMDTGEVQEINGGTFDPNRNYDSGYIYGNSFKNDSHNNHIQFGGNTTYSNVVNEYLTVVGGGETRIWRAHHYAESLDFEFGDEGDGRGAETVAEVERRYDYDGDVNMAALFLRGQISPVPEKLTFMLDGQVARYHHEVTENCIQQYDYYNRQFTDVCARSSQDDIEGWTTNDDGTVTATVVEDPDRPAELYERDFLFFQPKAGVNFNVNKQLNVFANYSQAKKEPKIGDWYFRSGVAATEREQNVVPESLRDLELGAGYRGESQAVTLNVYQMWFDDKIASVTDSRGDRYTVNAGNAIHQGVELSYKARAFDHLSAQASISLMNNRWTDVNEDAFEPCDPSIEEECDPENQQLFGVPLDEVVGSRTTGAPQRQAYLELGYYSDNIYLFANNLFWDKYYVLLNNDDLSDDENAAGFLNADGTLPFYNSLNLGVDYNKPLKNDRSLRARFIVENVLAREQYVDASYGRDFGRDGSYYLGVTQAPKRAFFFTLGGVI